MHAPCLAIFKKSSLICGVNSSKNEAEGKFRADEIVMIKCTCPFVLMILKSTHNCYDDLNMLLALGGERTKKPAAFGLEVNQPVMIGQIWVSAAVNMPN